MGRDLVIPTAPGWHIVDYKTNRLGAGGVREAVAPYLLQRSLYAPGRVESRRCRGRDLPVPERPEEPFTTSTTSADACAYGGTRSHGVPVEGGRPRPMGEAAQCVLSARCAEVDGQEK